MKPYYVFDIEYKEGPEEYIKSIINRIESRIVDLICMIGLRPDALYVDVITYKKIEFAVLKHNEYNPEQIHAVCGLEMISVPMHVPYFEVAYKSNRENINMMIRENKI